MILRTSHSTKIEGIKVPDTGLVLCVLMLLACWFSAAVAARAHQSQAKCSGADLKMMNTAQGHKAADAHVARSLQEAAVTTLLHDGAQHPHALPACELPPADRTNTSFDYYTFSALWPPSIFQFGESYTARLMVEHGVAADGFWVHGLWPSVSQGSSPMNCGTSQLQLSDIPKDILPNMTYWWPGTKVPFTQASAFDLWSHEWQKHGTCSGDNTSTYFTSAIHQAELHLPELTKLFISTNLTPNSNTPYKLGQIRNMLDAAYGDSYIISCDNNTAGQLMLSEVKLCLSHRSMQPCNCWQLTNGQVQQKKSSCGDNVNGSVWIMAFATEATYAGVNLSMAAAVIIGCTSGVVLLLVLAWLIAWQCGFISPLLKLKKVTVVHNPLIHEAVVVQCERLSMEWLWSKAPGLADFVHDLPAGMAIKGGIARKVLKHMYGTPEPPGSFDIDCLVLLPNEACQPGSGPDSHQAARLRRGLDSCIPGAESAARTAHDAVTGMQLGALQLEAQDVEVIPKTHLRDYFVSRDVTMNEVLILNSGQQPLLFYTAAAKADAEANLVRPSCHLRASEMQVYWEVDAATGVPYIGANVVCRCIIRYLKGHGSDYAFDAGTWAHYRQHKLDKPALFKIIRAFHSDSVKLQTAVDHLVDIGFLRRVDVWMAGGANKLWGLLLQDVNNSIARHGGRLQLGQLDPEGVEKWVTAKKAQTASKQLFAALRARRTGWLASDESAEGLGRLQLPQELETYIAAGPFFDYKTFMHLKQAKVLEALAGAAVDAAADLQSCTAPRLQPQKQHTSAGSAAAMFAGSPEGQATSASEVSMSKQQAWSSFVRATSLAGSHGQAVQSALQRYGSTVTQQHSTAQRMAGSATVAPGSEKDHSRCASQVALMLDAANAAQVGLLAQHRSRSAVIKSLQTAEQVQQIQQQQQQEQQQEGVPLLAAAREAGMSPASAGPVLPADKGKADGDDYGESIWQRFSEVGTFRDVKSQNQLGSFYQVLDTVGHSLLHPEQQAATIAADSERRGRHSRSTKQLLAFLFSTLRQDAWLYLLACVLILSGVACQLLLPWLEGQVFDVLSPWLVQQFFEMMGFMGILTAAALVLQLCGTMVLEFAARRVMARLFQRLFNHLLAQNPDFFNSISKGELMSRLSGDSLALRGMISSSLINLLQGVLIIFAIIGVLEFIWSATPYTGNHYFEMVLYISLAVSLAEALAAAAAARSLTVKARQATGRMFGFLLDIFSRTGAVCGLGLQGLIAHSYSAYVADVFRCTFNLNAFMDAHRIFSLGVRNVVVLLFVFFGGQEVMAGLTSIGTLVATLRYIRMQQRGVKQAVDSFVRLVGALGNLERLLDLHDRGTLATLPGNSSNKQLQQHENAQAVAKSDPSVPPLAVQQLAGALAKCSTMAAPASAGAVAHASKVAVADHGNQMAANTADIHHRSLEAMPGVGYKLADTSKEAHHLDCSTHPTTLSTVPKQAMAHDKQNDSGNRTFDCGCFGHKGSTTVSSSLTLLSDAPPAVSAAAAAAASKPIPFALAHQIELFASMTGGLRLCDVSVMVPGRAGRGAILQRLNLQVNPGTAALVIGATCEPLAPLLETAALLTVPYEGQVLLQLAALQHTTQQKQSKILACDHTAIDMPQQPTTNGSQDCCMTSANAVNIAPDTQQSCSQHEEQQHACSIPLPDTEEKQHEQVDAADTSSGAVGIWHAVLHLSDYLPAARSNIALVTVQTGAVFRGSVEDNVACAAAAAVSDVSLAGGATAASAGLTHRSVAEVCRRVGLADEVMLLPDGFRTVIGEGTGFTLSSKATLQLSLARALLKHPKLLLLGDIVELQAAVGRQRLLQLLQQQMVAGCAVLMTAVMEDDLHRSKDAAGFQEFIQGLCGQVQIYLMSDSCLQAAKASIKPGSANI